MKTEEFDVKCFESLSEESQAKVECIYHIASMLHANRLPKLNTTDFDWLYDKPLKELDAIVGNVRSHFHKAQYPEFEGE